MSGRAPTFSAWAPVLRELCARLRVGVRHALEQAVAAGDLGPLAAHARAGAGDVTFGIDVPAEDALDAWLDEQARQGPLSLLSEESGWRHRGPGPGGDPVELPGFDHGGPRIVIDPIDGTRNLMHDLRSAWTVIGFAGPGPAQPWLRDLQGGLVGELPTSRAARYRLLEAERGGECLLREGPVQGALEPGAARPLRTDPDGRADRGYFVFFRYPAPLRLPIAEVEARFFQRLAAQEGADLSGVFDDQYLSSGGQLAHLALGKYRMVVDLRAWLGPKLGLSAQPAKPYDISGAVICAQAAGCIVRAPDGSPLDVPLDTSTPVSFAAYANAATAARLQPHLDAARS